MPPVPLSYPALYAFFRERAEAGPDPLRDHPDTAALLRRPGTAREIWELCGQRTTRRRPVYNRMYGAGEVFATVLHPDTLYRSGYRGTAPENAVTFARGWVDGMHFNFVTDANGRWSPQSPVVLTDPGYGMGQLGNAVVGLDLRECLNLGMKTGFQGFSLLIRDPDAFLDQYPAHARFGDISDRMAEELTALAERFGLVPWEKDAIRPRLAELDRMIRPRLVFPEHGS